MDLYSFLSSVLSSLAWPFVVVFFYWTFRSQISSKLDAIESARFPGGEVSFLDVKKAVAYFPNSSVVRRELTDREQQVAVLILAGFTVPQTAEMMEISERTVEVYRARLFDATQTKTIDELRDALARH